MGMHHEIHPTWTLILGKGPDTDLLQPLLEGLASSHRSVRIEILDGPVPELPAPSRRGRLVLHAASLEGHHLAQVQQYLAQASGWELILLDRDGLPCLAKDLVGPSHVYWWPGPITVEQAMRLFHPPRSRDSAQLPRAADVLESSPGLPETPTARKNSPLHFTDPDEELGAIQAILSAPYEDLDESGWMPESIEPHLPEPLPEIDAPSDFPEFTDFPEDCSSYEPEREDDNMHPPAFDPFSTAPSIQNGSPCQQPSYAPSPISEHPVDVLLRSLEEEPNISLEQALADDFAAPQAHTRPETDWPQMAWYKGQIADLNDLAQRLHLDLFALEEDASLQGHSIAIALREDVARLSQFARTLSFLVAPPSQGEQTFSLATLVQEQLGALTGLGPEAPRFLFRSQAQADVRSDKMLLVSALDALLQVAGQCAGKHPETVRVECLTEAEFAHIRISFSPGPIAAFATDEVFEPYALRACLADIGPNALSAARSILRGQGGNLVLEQLNAKPWTFVLSLPLAD
ncbi:MAG: hypothetical protein ACI89E_000153 [Planctomycetota bacterium]|jgi:hypothetical protein